MFHSFFTHSSLDGYLNGSDSLSVMHIHIQAFFVVVTSVFCGPTSETDGSYDNSMVTFSRNYQTVFHSDCAVSHPCQHCVRTLTSPHPLQHCIFFCCCCLVAKSCPIFCDPRDCSMPRLPCPSLSPGVFSDSS